MRFTSGISDVVNATAATDAACRQAAGQLVDRRCDLACVFVSTIYKTSWPDVLHQVHERLHPRVLIGCSGSGIIGGEQEMEWVPAISVVAASLPDVKLFPFVASPDELEHASAGGFWVDKVGASPEAEPVFVVFVDPLTSSPMRVLDELNHTYRTRPIVGGLVSGGREPGEQLLFLGGEVLHEGMVGVAMTGNITMDAIVSQGCRPIGRPYVVTKAEEQLIFELGGRQALVALHEVLSSLLPDDRELARQGAIVLGVVVNELRSKFVPGDFLIRSIVGLDPEQGALAVAEEVRVGQTVQFHLRDAATSRQELRRLLVQSGKSPHDPIPAGCLMFNCTGRGKSFYGTPHHDVKTLRTVSGNVPVGGFFCNGEIGPIGTTNFLHGYTASLGLFRPRTP